MRSYPKSTFEVINNTSIEQITTTSVSGIVPIMMAAYTSPKGTEDWELLYGLDGFTNTKGGLNFAQHGQSQFLVANLLRSGSYVLAKRMVSENATLANVTVKAKVHQVEGVSYIYIYTSSLENAKTFAEACTAGYGTFDASAAAEDVTVNEKSVKAIDVPLFTVTPLGRGISGMSIRLVPEYYVSKSSKYMRYTFEISENAEVIESISCTLNPNIIIDGTLQSVESKVKNASKQVKVKVYDDGFEKLVRFLTATATTTKETITYENGIKKVNKSTVPVVASELVNLDFINGFDKKENPIAGIITKDIVSSGKVESNIASLWDTFKPEGIDTFYSLTTANGIPLVNGSYGTMGTASVQNAEEYENMLLGTFGANTSSSLYDDIIYDLDRYKIDCIFDCAYPVSVKNAIVNLVDFRGDCVFLADLGTSKNTLDDIVEEASKITKSQFVAIYHNYFDVVDSFTKKQITVTMPYLLASRMVNHIAKGVGKPFAGIANGLSFGEIVVDTINFKPVVIPGTDQKQVLADNCINYLSYYNEVPVMESMWVNDENYTQLSFLHNIMAVQEIIKIIRSRCPSTRYSFLDGDDLEQYLTDANSIIKEYRTNFKSISMTYMADENYESNNIFYAVIKVQFHKFVNEEYFKVIAID